MVIRKRKAMKRILFSLLLPLMFACGSKAPIGDAIRLDVKDGRASATVEKDSMKSVVFAFDSGNYKLLSGSLASADSTANVRFSQIIMPDSTMDGPFGREIQYVLSKKGIYRLIVNENMMAGDPWSGEFTVNIKLTE